MPFDECFTRLDILISFLSCFLMKAKYREVNFCNSSAPFSCSYKSNSLFFLLCFVRYSLKNMWSCCRCLCNVMLLKLRANETTSSSEYKSKGLRMEFSATPIEGSLAKVFKALFGVCIRCGFHI